LTRYCIVEDEVSDGRFDMHVKYISEKRWLIAVSSDEFSERKTMTSYH